LPAVFFIVAWFGVQVLSGFTSISVFGSEAGAGGVAFFAHIGGFVAGALVARLVLSVGRGPGRPAAPATVG
jgi:membrane associated rhomboid family serine protease